MKKPCKQIKKSFQILFFIYLINITSICSAFSLSSDFFKDIIALTLSQITRTQVSFQNFESSFSPKMIFKLEDVKFKKRGKILLWAKTLRLEPSPNFLLSWRKTSSSNAFMNFNLEDGRTEKIDFKEAEGILRTNAETITLEPTKISLAKGEVLLSGDYQKNLKAFDGTITAKQFALNSFKEIDLSGIVDLNANVQGYVSQKRKIIPMSGVGKILALNGSTKNSYVANLVLEALKLTKQDASLSTILNFNNLSGSFSISQGILQTSDLKFKGNTLNVDGEGKLNFLTQSFDLKFQIKKNPHSNHQSNFGLRGTFKQPEIYRKVN